jgi:hypothetical protein
MNRRIKPKSMLAVPADQRLTPTMRRLEITIHHGAHRNPIV